MQDHEIQSVSGVSTQRIGGPATCQCRTAGEMPGFDLRSEGDPRRTSILLTLHLLELTVHAGTGEASVAPSRDNKVDVTDVGNDTLALCISHRFC